VVRATALLSAIRNLKTGRRLTSMRVVTPLRRPLNELAPSLNAVRARLRIDAWARAALRVQSLHGRSDYRRFVIVGLARTGSTLLVNLLNAHSQVLTFGELFRSPDAIGWDVRPFAGYQSPKLLAQYRSDPNAFLQAEVFRRWPRRYEAIGFKLFYYHARERRFSEVWNYLRDDRDVRVVHMRRRNILKQYLSLRIAHATDVWSVTTTPVHEPAAIRLDAEECGRHFKFVRDAEAACARIFEYHHVLDVFYEELAEHQDRAMASVQDFLGLRREKLRTTLVRQRKPALPRAIANFEDLRGAFIGTQWEPFFHDGSERSSPRGWSE